MQGFHRLGTTVCRVEPVEIHHPKFVNFDILVASMYRHADTTWALEFLLDCAFK